MPGPASSFSIGTGIGATSVFARIASTARLPFEEPDA